MSPTFRRAVAADVPALAALYRDTALALGPQVYTPEQVAAWARSTEDVDRAEPYQGVVFERYRMGTGAGGA